MLHMAVKNNNACFTSQVLAERSAQTSVHLSLLTLFTLLMILSVILFYQRLTYPDLGHSTLAVCPLPGLLLKSHDFKTQASRTVNFQNSELT